MTALSTRQQKQTIRQLLNDVFKDKRRAAMWMVAPNVFAGGEAPADMIRTADGAEIVETLLGRIKYGVYS